MIYYNWDLDFIKYKITTKEDVEDVTDTLVYLLEKVEDEKERNEVRVWELSNDIVDSLNSRGALNDFGKEIKDNCELICDILDY